MGVDELFDFSGVDLLPDFVDLESAVGTLKVIMAAYESSDKGVPVYI